MATAGGMARRVRGRGAARTSGLVNTNTYIVENYDQDPAGSRSDQSSPGCLEAMKLGKYR